MITVDKHTKCSGLFIYLFMNVECSGLVDYNK